MAIRSWRLDSQKAENRGDGFVREQHSDSGLEGRRERGWIGGKEFRNLDARRMALKLGRLVRNWWSN